MGNDNDTESTNMLELIRANARALYGRHQTYDILTSFVKPPQRLQDPRFDGRKVHALLVAYRKDDLCGKGKVLMCAYSIGVHKTAPSVQVAIQLLYNELKNEISNHYESIIRTREFDGALMGGDAVRGGTDIDGITLRGD